MEDKIFALLSDYFKAKNENDIQAMWNFIYDRRGDQEYDFFDQTSRELAEFRKTGMQVSYKLMEVKNIRIKEKDSFYPKGGWAATIVYQVSGWQREKEMVLVDNNGKLLIDCKSKI